MEVHEGGEKRSESMRERREKVREHEREERNGQSMRGRREKVIT